MALTLADVSIPVVMVLCWLSALNAVAFGAFYFDKRRSIQGGWRVPERRLLLFALLGGWFGAKLAQNLFRHKTQKQPFARMLNIVPLVWGAQVALTLAILSWW